MSPASTNDSERRSPIPILYLVDMFETPLGGSEGQLLTLLEGLDRARFDPYLAFLRSNPDLVDLAFPCPVSVLGYRSLAGLDFLQAGRRCVSFCRNKRIRIVHTYFRDASRVGALWARAGGVRVVVGSRRNLGDTNGPAKFALLRLLAPLTTHTIANSKAAAEKAVQSERLDPTRVSVIANGLKPGIYAPIDESRRQAIRRGWGVPEGSLVVGAVANLRPIKNIPFLVEAAARLGPRFPELCFVVLGDGIDRPALEALIRARGLAGRFLLPGFSRNVPVDVQAFDIAVLCSNSESSPNSIIEYLATGRPTLASSVGGIPEILTSEDIGFLYHPNDAVRFDSVLSSLIEGPELRSTLSESARAYAVLRFSVERMVREHEALYAALLDRAGGKTFGK